MQDFILASAIVIQSAVVLMRAQYDLHTDLRFGWRQSMILDFLAILSMHLSEDVLRS